VRQHTYPGDVTDCPHTVGDPQVVIHRDAVRTGLNSDRFETNTVYPRPPPSSHQQPIATNLAATVEL
jgi:hypothetical protein